jgi:cobalamin biosynthesis Mg chelatase CobN
MPLLTHSHNHHANIQLLLTHSHTIPQARELEEVLRLEYRSKLLNPKWAQAMAAQGSGGAYEISSRMTALLGWGGTTGYADAFAWDQVRLNDGSWTVCDRMYVCMCVCARAGVDVDVCVHMCVC